MMKKRNELTADYIMDYWLEKGHGINVQWLKDNEAELIKTPEWYRKYPVTQELHDEWYDWAIQTIMKYYRCSKKYAKRQFAVPYLNLSPSVKEDNKDVPCKRFK